MNQEQRKTLLDLLVTVDDTKKDCTYFVQNGSDADILSKLRRLNNVTSDISEIANSFFKQNSLLEDRNKKV